MIGVIAQISWEIHPVLPNGFYSGSPIHSSSTPVVIEVKCDNLESAKQKVINIIDTLRGFQNVNN